MKRLKVIFKGRVQGVGFRYRAFTFANELGLSGSVENLYDGSVRLFIQGEGFLIEKFLDKMNNQNFIRIDNMDKTDLDPIKEDEFIILN